MEHIPLMGIHLNIKNLLSFKSVGIGYGRAKGNSRVYDSLFRNQLGKSGGRNNPADEGGRRTARVVATFCVLGVKHSSLSARLREQ